jgi:hypothetical protein
MASTITALPTAPSRDQDSDTFVTNANAWVAALDTFTTETNTVASEAETDAATAETKATEAAASAASAIALTTTNATSSSSVAIGTGAKSFTIETGKNFVIGMPIRIADDAAPATNWMQGIITAYTTGTGVLDVTVDTVGGSGTKSAWTVTITGVSGADGTSDISLDTTPTLGGPLDGAGYQADNLILNDTGWLTQAKGNLGATPAFDLSAGQSITGTVDQAITSSTITNPIASDDYMDFAIKLTGGGDFAIVWPTSFKWSGGGTAPTLTASSGIDTIVGYTVDGGTTYQVTALTDHQ